MEDIIEKQIQEFGNLINSIFNRQNLAICDLQKRIIELEKQVMELLDNTFNKRIIELEKQVADMNGDLK